MEISVNGVILYYETRGSGAPLIMVHGNGESHDIFTEAAEILKDYFTVYLIDSRGHGRSTPVTEYHYATMAEDIAAFIARLGLKDITYYGFSDGGIIGLLLAAQPGLCKRYIVSGTNARPDAVRKWLLRVLKVQYFFTRNPKVELMLQEPFIPDSELKQIRDEVVLLAGSKDVILEEHTRHLQEVIPGSKLEILPGETHGSYIVHSTKIAELILKYTGKA